jgi:hypothetical protein
MSELLEQPGYRFNIEKSVARFSKVSAKISFEDEFMQDKLATKDAAVHIQCYPYVAIAPEKDVLKH